MPAQGGHAVDTIGGGSRRSPLRRTDHQGLTPVDRDALDEFVAVEWSGTEIGSAKTE